MASTTLPFFPNNPFFQKGKSPAMKNIKSTVRNFFVVNQESWHYKLLKEINEGDITTNPWFYWPYCFPFVVWMAGVSLVIAVFGISVYWVLGRSPNTKENRVPGKKFFLPYRMTKTGRRKLFVPWEIIFMSFPVYLTEVFWFGTHPNIWVIMAVMSPLLFITTAPTIVDKSKWDL